MSRTTRIRVIGIAAAMTAGLITSANAIPILTIDGLINTTPGTVQFGEVGLFLSGGTGLVGRDGFWPTGPPDVIAGSNIDHYWVQGVDGNPVIWSFRNPTNKVLGFAGIDHGPLPQEALEWTLWGSNDLSTWEEGTIQAIYDDGWDSTNSADGHSDDWSSLWAFTSRYTYVRATTHSHLIPDYHDGDFEIDGVAALVPEPGTLLLLSLGIVTAGLFRRLT